MSGGANTGDKIPVDLELKKAFGELQQKMIDTRQKLKFSDSQVEGLKKNIMHKQITDKEMGALPTDTKVYQSVGRCFFASTVPEVRENIGKSIKEYQDKIKVYEQNKEFLERDIKGSENALRELIHQKKNAQ
jgi:prefoldin subunit 1